MKREKYIAELEAAAEELAKEAAEADCPPAVSSEAISEMLKRRAQPARWSTVTSEVREGNSMRSIPNGVLKFGKHSGKLISTILKEDRSYLEWMLRPEAGMPEDLKTVVVIWLKYDGATAPLDSRLVNR